MGKRILAVMLLVFSGNIFAEWRAISTSDTITTYIDSETITKVGDRSKVWSMMDLSKPTPFRSGEAEFLSIRNQWEFDCKNAQWRVLWAGYYPRNKANGLAVATQNTPNSEFAPLAPGTVVGFLSKEACAQK